MTTKAFASRAELEEKKVSFTKLSDNAYAYGAAEGLPAPPVRPPSALRPPLGRALVRPVSISPTTCSNTPGKEDPP